MSREPRGSVALSLALIALFAALGGTVYAASKIDGKTIKIKSLPGNRLKPSSVPGDRLQPGAIPGNRLKPGSITGNQIDASTLGQVPTAVHADNADSARDAETALNAVSATTAIKINGHSAGCAQSERFFAGACWQATSSEAAVTAPTAAVNCANRGAELPNPLMLAAFSQEPGIVLAPGGEWSSDVTNLSGKNVYALVTVTASGEVDSAASTAPHKYRCVTPLVT